MTLFLSQKENKLPIRLLAVDVLLNNNKKCKNGELCKKYSNYKKHEINYIKQMKTEQQA